MLHRSSEWWQPSTSRAALAECRTRVWTMSIAGVVSRTDTSRGYSRATARNTSWSASSALSSPSAGPGVSGRAVHATMRRQAPRASASAAAAARARSPETSFVQPTAMHDPCPPSADAGHESVTTGHWAWTATRSSMEPRAPWADRGRSGSIPKTIKAADRLRAISSSLMEPRSSHVPTGTLGSASEAAVALVASKAWQAVAASCRSAASSDGGSTWVMIKTLRRIRASRAAHRTAWRDAVDRSTPTTIRSGAVAAPLIDQVSPPDGCSGRTVGHGVPGL